MRARSTNYLLGLLVGSKLSFENRCSLIVSENVREREREKEKLSDVHRQQDEQFKLWKDETSEERFLNRSRKIRKATREFLSINLGVLFDDTEDIASQAANYAEKYLRGSPCSSITTRRWILQFCNKNGPFKAVTSPAGVVIWEREKK